MNEQNLKPFGNGPDPRRNVNGRPKKLPQLDVLLEKVLGEEKHEVTELERIIKKLKLKAKAGDIRAAELLLDRYFGKVAQKMQISTGDSEPTEFVLPSGRKIII